MNLQSINLLMSGMVEILEDDQYWKDMEGCDSKFKIGSQEYDDCVRKIKKAQKDRIGVGGKAKEIVGAAGSAELAAKYFKDQKKRKKARR